MVENKTAMIFMWCTFVPYEQLVPYSHRPKAKMLVFLFFSTIHMDLSHSTMLNPIFHMTFYRVSTNVMESSDIDIV